MTGSRYVEIEARLLVSGPQRAELFEHIQACAEVAGHCVGSFADVVLEDTYHDREVGTLAAIDCALRVRRERRAGRETTLLTFKGPATSGASHCVERLELEAPFGAEILADVCAELRGRGVEIGDSTPTGMDAPHALAQLGFSPIQSRRTTRQVAPLGPQENPVAELTLDEVQYEFHGVSIVHREVELEACGAGSAADVLGIADQLQESFPGELAPWRWSKTAVGRGLETLQEAGQLEELLEHQQLTSEGYERLNRALSPR